MKQASTRNKRNNFTALKPSVIRTIHRIHTETISTIPNSPFPVREDPSMHELVESISQFGILVPIEVRPAQPGRYEIISGSRRYHAATVISLEFIPAIILDLDDDEAIIRMVDSNIQRENLLPSERAFAYKMRMEAVKRKAGRPQKDKTDNSPKVSAYFRSDDVIGKKCPE